VAKTERITLDVAGREVSISNPKKVFFPEAGLTKLDLVNYYLAVSEGALRGIRNRPMALKRYVNGIDGDFFFQKRAPKSRPDWIKTVTLAFPSGRTADEIVIDDAAQLAWIINLGCVDLNPHPVRTDDLAHPDELRIDLDPVPGVQWGDIREVALVTREVLTDHGLVGWPKTSGSRGIHINVRIERKWDFDAVRRSALAVAREVERRAPTIATSKWWKEERHGVFLDYNQNAKDRTVASVYSVRPMADARVSTPLTWDEVPSCQPEEFTVLTVPARFRDIGDPGAGIDDSAGSLELLLELGEKHERDGVGGEAAWPPHYPKQDGEPPRVQPSKRKKSAKPEPEPEPELEPEPEPEPKPEPEPEPEPRVRGRRRPKFPLLTIAKSADKAEALAGLERWKARYPEAASCLEPADVLVDAMRGRFTTWTRIRINLKNVPEEKRPPQETPDPDYNPRPAS
jgi:DNA ligase D-like protein (predicted polymerase)